MIIVLRYEAKVFLMQNNKRKEIGFGCDPSQREARNLAAESAVLSMMTSELVSYFIFFNYLDIGNCV